MLNNPPFTYEDVAAALLEIGMISADKARAVLDQFADYARDPLDRYGVAAALQSFDLAVTVHADDVDFLEESYEHLLVQAAGLTGGAVTVTDVRLHQGEPDDDGRDDVLEFKRDGEVVTVHAEHFSDEYLDHLAAGEAIGHLSPDDPRRFHEVGFERDPNRVYETVIALATPEQARALHERFGLVLR
ncbi:hypothetical protein [Saccharothrix sp. Mg75]|uniref:hypothetical protein n=1 Tax=Saccharothrix sp. Mg75 TaxID=3445357 RepID=UPI003EE9CBB2